MYILELEARGPNFYQGEGVKRHRGNRSYAEEKASGQE